VVPETRITFFVFNLSMTSRQRMYISVFNLFSGSRHQMYIYWWRGDTVYQSLAACWWLSVGILDYSINKTNHRDIVEIWVCRYQRGKQKPSIKEEHTTLWPKRTNDLQNITHKTKERVTRTPLNTPLTLWVRIPLMARWYSISVTCGMLVVICWYSGLLHQ
jgi:hypothetical protein